MIIIYVPTYRIRALVYYNTNTYAILYIPTPVDVIIIIRQPIIYTNYYNNTYIGV